MMHSRLGVVLITLFTVVRSASATLYTFTTLDDPTQYQNPTFTVGGGINNAGQVVGAYVDTSLQEQGYLFSGGTYSNIDDPNATGGTIARGINNMDKIVGEYVGANTTEQGFVLSGGTFSTIDDPSAPGGYGTDLTGINDSGQIVGDLQNASDNIGFLLSGGTFSTIDDPNAVTADGGTFVAGINDAGAIVGLYYDASGEHGFSLIGGVYTTIDDPSALPGNTFISGINSAGEMVGGYYDGTNYNLFIDDAGTFTTIADPYTAAGGEAVAVGINDKDQISGNAADAVGNHGFLATPAQVPEPGTLLILASGLISLALIRRRKI
jgi:hypothetical protein